MASNKLISIAKNNLDDLINLLKFDYVRGYLFTEADIQFSVIRHLYNSLSKKDDRWFVGAEHVLKIKSTDKKWKPDISCFYLPQKLSKFIEDQERYLVAVIEIKYWKNPLSDLKKLTSIQRSKDCLVWSIFANHFDSTIHQKYAEQSNDYQSEVEKWIQRSPEKRGATIIKCDRIPKSKRFSKYSDRVEALREHFWIND